jgi:hypothetical protein
VRMITECRDRGRDRDEVAATPASVDPAGPAEPKKHDAQ